jgi:hypothetical protein
MLKRGLTLALTLAALSGCASTPAPPVDNAIIPTRTFCTNVGGYAMLHPPEFTPLRDQAATELMDAARAVDDADPTRPDLLDLTEHMTEALDASNYDAARQDLIQAQTYCVAHGWTAVSGQGDGSPNGTNG